MRYLYIDDERYLKTLHPWVIVRSYAEAINYFNNHGIPEYISFDHDLGNGPSGYDIAKWLVNADLDGTHKIPDNFQFNVHSANPIGVINITECLRSYLRFRSQKP